MPSPLGGGILRFPVPLNCAPGLSLPGLSLPGLSLPGLSLTAIGIARADDQPLAG